MSNAMGTSALVALLYEVMRIVPLPDTGDDIRTRIDDAVEAVREEEYNAKFLLILPPEVLPGVERFITGFGMALPISRTLKWTGKGVALIYWPLMGEYILQRLGSNLAQRAEEEMETWTRLLGDSGRDGGEG